MWVQAVSLPFSIYDDAMTKRMTIATVIIITMAVIGVVLSSVVIVRLKSRYSESFRKSIVNVKVVFYVRYLSC